MRMERVAPVAPWARFLVGQRMRASSAALGAPSLKIMVSPAWAVAVPARSPASRPRLRTLWVTVISSLLVGLAALSGHAPLGPTPPTLPKSTAAAVTRGTRTYPTAPPCGSSSVADRREHASRGRARGLLRQHQDHEPGLNHFWAQALEHAADVVERAYRQGREVLGLKQAWKLRAQIGGGGDAADLLGPVRLVGDEGERTRQREGTGPHESVGSEAVGEDAADAAGTVGIVAVGIGVGPRHQGRFDLLVRTEPWARAVRRGEHRARRCRLAADFGRL